MTSSESEVRALLESRVEACQRKDLDRLMSLYAHDAVYFDVVPPLHFTGADEIRRNFRRWFDGYDGPLRLETHDLRVAAGGDVAFAHMLHRSGGIRADGVEVDIWVRSTVCCERADGTWRITHEHVSIPAVRG